MILFPIRLTHFFTAISLLFVCAVFPIWSQDVGDPLIADFRYPPEWWQTSICLPDDWQKTLVGKDGSLLYDHPGKFNSFKTKITAEAAGKIEWVSQELASPRFPLVQTVKRNGPIEITEEAFTIAPPFIERLIPGVDAVVIESIGKKTVLTHWAQPPQDVDPAFRHIEVAYVKPLRYRFKALPDTDYTVVFGLCEGFHDEGGIRILDLMVEGTVAQNVDMVAGKGRNVPALFAFPAIDGNGDGYIDLAVKPNIESSDANSFLNVLWVFQGTDIPPLDRLMTGEVISEALAYRDCGFRLPDGSPRQDMLIVRYRNVGVRSATAVPAITIQSELDVAPNESKTRMIFNQWNQVVFSQPFEKIERTDTTSRLRFAPIGLPSGESHVLKAVVKRGKFAVNIPFEPYYIDFLKRRSEAYWRERDLPYGHIQIPDPTIQALLDSSIRNIYQAREIKKGLPAFQVGPTVYRGLWVVDGAFILESIAYLNRVEEARAGIDYLLAFQREDGAFMLIDGHWKETGIVLWAVTRHARLTHDKPWLESVWPRVERGFAYIQSMRAMPDPSALNARLIPEGFSDGGLAGRYPEYTNVYWTMTGLKAAADAARWLDKGEQAEIWQEEYDDFYKTFRNAAERDMSTDDQGNTFLPTRMRDDQNVRPQKAQWAFLHAVFPGNVFEADDPLVRGNMAMLRATEREGMVWGTGWLSEGIWNYFASFYGNAWLWLGDGRKAGESLYAFANHASPLLCWREEHNPQGEGEAITGDMPHNWASAEFIRLTRHLLVLERGDELHLLEGLPAQWARPGAVTKVNDLLTEFGTISFELAVADDGETAMLKVQPPKRNPPARLVLHLETWTFRDEIYDLSVEDPSNSTIQLKPE